MEAEKDGFPVTAMREIKLLQSLRHENVVQLYEMMVSAGTLSLIWAVSLQMLTGCRIGVHGLRVHGPRPHWRSVTNTVLLL